MESLSKRTDAAHARTERIAERDRSAARATEIGDEQTGKRRLIRTETFESRLRGTERAISARHGDALVALLHAESARLGQLVREDLFQAYVAAKETVVALQARLVAICAAKADADQRASR